MTWVRRVWSRPVHRVLAVLVVVDLVALGLDWGWLLGVAAVATIVSLAWKVREDELIDLEGRPGLPCPRDIGGRR